MGFIKKNYEKILLGVVLLGLVVALAALPIWITKDREDIKTASEGLIKRSPKPLDPLDLTRQSNIVSKVESPYVLDLETTNKVFNPLQWQKARDGRLIPIKAGNEIGGDAVVVAQITPLYLILTLDSVTTNELGARYVIGVERQASPVPAQRRRVQRYVSPGDQKNDVFALRDVKGPPESPTEMIFQLTDSNETISLSKEKPFRRVDGFSADLKYDPEGKKWQGTSHGGGIKICGG
ncbi:MAG: hypothetical protein WDM76_11655 [Limisphaerales bacterium]